MGKAVQEKEFNVVDFVMEFEGGELSEREMVRGFQHLINDGTVWQFQGFYGRTANALLSHGFCKPAGKWTPEEAVEYFDTYLDNL